MFHWRRHWMLVCTHVPCALADAQKVLLVVGAHLFLLMFPHMPDSLPIGPLQPDFCGGREMPEE